MAKKPAQARNFPQASTELSSRELGNCHQTLDRVRSEIAYAINQLAPALSSPNARVAQDRMCRCLDSLERCEEELRNEVQGRNDPVKPTLPQEPPILLDPENSH